MRLMYYLMLIPFWGLAQVDTTYLMESNELVVYSVSNIKESIYFFDKKKNIRGLIVEERLTKQNKVAPSSEFSRILAVEISGDNVGILFLRREVVVYFLYKIAEQSKLVNACMIGVITTKTSQIFRLLDASTVYIEDFAIRADSKILIFNEEAKFQLFESPRGLEENTFFTNLMKFKDD